MPKPTNAVELVKKAAVEAVDASKPVHILFGTVISASPLKIQVDQKAIYTNEQNCSDLLEHDRQYPSHG